MISFWKWLFIGSGAGPGIRRFFDRWLLMHGFIGAVFAFVLPITLEKAGTGLLLPLAGIFIGLTFAWGGNAQALLQTREIEKLANYRSGGYAEYLYVYQAAVLLILVSLTLWAIAGLGIFDRVWPVHRHSVSYELITGLLFFFASLTLRECWHVVLGAQAMLLVRFRINKNCDDE